MMSAMHAARVDQVALPEESVAWAVFLDSYLGHLPTAEEIPGLLPAHLKAYPKYRQRHPPLCGIPRRSEWGVARRSLSSSSDKSPSIIRLIISLYFSQSDNVSHLLRFF
jgi:hypothetical protein